MKRVLSPFANKIRNVALWVMAVTSIFLFSCKKDYNDVDQMNADMAGQKVSYVESGVAMSLYGQLYHTTPNYIGISILLNNAAPEADTVFAEVVPSLVETYNQAFGEHNLAIPDSAFIASNKGVFPLIAGQMQAKDSLYAVLHNATSLSDSIIYLVPIRLTEKKSAGLKTKLFFFKMQVFKNGAITAAVNIGNIYKDGRLYTYAPTALNLVSQGVNILKVGVKLNAVLMDHDLKVSANMINSDSLALSYGNFLSFPANSVSLIKSEATIPAGSLYSKDSLVLNLAPGTSFLSFKSYLLSINLQEYLDANYRVPIKAGEGKALITVYMY